MKQSGIQREHRGLPRERQKKEFNKTGVDDYRKLLCHLEAAHAIEQQTRVQRKMRA